MQHRQGTPDLILFLVTVILLGLGVIMVFSSSSVKALAELGDPYYYLKRQLLFALLGIGVMSVVMRVDYHYYHRWLVPGLFISFFLLAIVPFVGEEISGSRRWINLGLFNLQPSELAKIAMIFFVASWIATRGGEITDFWRGLLPPLLLLMVAFSLIMLQPDLGTAGALAVTVIVMLFVGGVRLSHLGFLVLLALPAIGALVYLEPYRMQRFLAFLHPWEDPLGTGFHIIQSLLALGSGGIFGLGLGRSRQKFWYLPEQHTDFIFAILGEELGFLGTLAIVTLFFLFAWRGIRVAMTAPDTFGSMLATGITGMITIQALLNMGVVSGSLPITGITLPLISYGGSSLVITLAGIGILLNVSRQARI